MMCGLHFPPQHSVTSCPPALPPYLAPSPAKTYSRTQLSKAHVHPKDNTLEMACGRCIYTTCTRPQKAHVRCKRHASNSMMCEETTVYAWNAWSLLCCVGVRGLRCSLQWGGGAGGHLLALVLMQTGAKRRMTLESHCRWILS